MFATYLACIFREIALGWMSEKKISSQHWSRRRFGFIRQQAIVGICVDQFLCRHLASLGPCVRAKWYKWLECVKLHLGRVRDLLMYHHPHPHPHPTPHTPIKFDTDSSSMHEAGSMFNKKPFLVLHHDVTHTCRCVGPTKYKQSACFFGCTVLYMSTNLVITFLVPSHYANQCYPLVKRTLRKNFTVLNRNIEIPGPKSFRCKCCLRHVQLCRPLSPFRVVSMIKRVLLAIWCIVQPYSCRSLASVIAVFV